MTDVRDRDWIEFLAELIGEPLTEWPQERIACQLLATFASTGCAFHARSPDGPPSQRLWPPDRFAAHLDEMTDWAFRRAPECHPLLRYYLATGDARSMQVTDVPARFADERVMAAWFEVGRRWLDVPHQLALPLLATPTANRSFVLGRADPFTAQEMELAARLRRILAGLDRQVTLNARWAATGGPLASEVADALRLTPRELAVLQLLADGLTAASIGRRLTIAERTVQKHLEHSYAKLGVADRLGAVLRAQTIGLLPRCEAT